MKTTSFSLLALAAVLLPAAGRAAQDGKRPPNAAHHRGGAMSEVLQPFDKNGNHQIDAEELPALQQAYTTLKNLDKNANGELELTEVETPKSPAMGGRRGRMLAGFKEVDKNGNHKIDADEVANLEKKLAGRKIMTRLDHNSNGKIDADELAQLNQRLAHSGRRGPAAGAPNLRKPPEKPAETAPQETPKAEEKKPEAPAFGTKPPGDFGK